MLLKFFYAPMSSAITVHWALEELGVRYEGIKLNFSDEGKLDTSNGNISRDDYLKMNPNGKVPRLVVDGTPIFESNAILFYLGETFGVDKGLFPKSGLERAHCQQWMIWCQQVLGDSIARMYRNNDERIPSEQRNEFVLKAAKLDIYENLKILNAHLESRVYMNGPTFSLADIMLGSAAAWLEMLKIDVAQHREVKDWLSRVTDRPAFGVAMKG